MKAMVLAAGLGVRFRPITLALPKPLVPVCNHPVLAWIIDDLRRQGVDEVVVNAHHHASQIERYLRERYRGKPTIHVTTEARILGTGGGIANARGFLEDGTPFLVVNGDTIQDLPVESMLRVLDESNGLAVMLLREQSESEQYTPVEIERGRVKRIGGSPGEPRLMFAGFHALNPEIFEEFPGDEVFDIVTDVYRPILAGGRIAATVAGPGGWHDLGNAVLYLRACGDLLDEAVSGVRRIPDEKSIIRGDSLVSVSSRIEGDIQKTTIGPASTLGRGSRVLESVVWAGVTIGTNAWVASSVITDGVVVPDRARIRNAVLVQRTADMLVDPSWVVQDDVVAAPLEPDAESLAEW